MNDDQITGRRHGWHDLLRRWVLLGILLFTAGTVVLLWWASAVGDSITPTDRSAFDGLAKRCEFVATDSLSRIRELQLCVLATIPHAILGRQVPREPADIIRAGRGECYDRARVIEKFLQIEGFKTRHVFLIDTTSYGLLSLVRPQSHTHAMVDVKTNRGWMAVGTNTPFLGMTVGGDAVSSANAKMHVGDHWIFSAPQDLAAQSNIAIYGLWSRHGQFFRPFLPVPDISWNDFKYNFGPDR